MGSDTGMSRVAGAVLYDLSEFIRSPLRTGIQRVSLEILMNWSSPTPLQPFFLAADGSGIRLLPPGFPELMRGLFEGHVARADLHAAEHAAELIGWEEFWRFDTLINAEVFFDPARARFYRWVAGNRGDDLHWIVHDFLPWLNPQMFGRDATAHSMYYVQAMRSIGHLHFTSRQMRDLGVNRVLRGTRQTLSVLPLGGDSLGRAATPFDPANRRFTCVGTIEPRKRHALVLDAAERLWREGASLELVFVGRAGWSEHEFMQRMRRLAAVEPRFRWIDTAGDADVRDIVIGSRATIFASELEGFGLPPLESLSLGVPVVAFEGLPSLESLADRGQLRLSKVSVDTLSDAMHTLLDDAAAARLRQEAAELNVLGWAGYCAALAGTLDHRRAA